MTKNMDFLILAKKKKKKKKEEEKGKKKKRWRKKKKSSHSMTLKNLQRLTDLFGVGCVGYWAGNRSIDYAVLQKCVKSTRFLRK